MGTRNKDSDGRVEKESSPNLKVPTFGRGVLLVAAALNLGLGLGIPFTLSVVFLDWQESFSTSRAATAAVHSTCVGLLYGAGVVAGYVINRFGARASFILGSCLASHGMFLGAFATNISFLLVTVGVLGGCGFSLIQTPCIPCCTRPFPTHQGVAIAVVTSGASLVMLALPYVYDFLIRTYSWRGAFIIITGIVLNSLVLELIATSYRSPPQQTELQVSPPETVELVSANDDVISCDDIKSDGCHKDKEGSLVYSVLDIDQTSGKTCIGDVDVDEVGRDRDKKGEACNKGSNQGVSVSYLPKDDAHEDDTSRETLLDKGDSANKNNDRATDDSQPCRPPSRHASSMARFRHSPWRFLLDPLSWAILIFLGPAQAGLFSVQLLIMDIAANKGFHDEGLLLVMAIVISGLMGKALAGALSLCRSLPSFVLLAASGLLGGVAIVVLGTVSNLPAIVVSISALGVSLGLIVAVFPKCFLDMSSVDAASFPVAVGMGGTMKGVCEFLVPVRVGHMVDVSGTYTLPFSILSGVSFLCSCLLVVVFRWTKRNRNR